jgi:hypothetical protein
MSERRPTVHRWSDNNGNSRVRGTSNLKATQAYPADFGLAVGRLFANVEGRSTEGVSFHDLPKLVVNTTDSWGDAGLDSVLSALEAL